MGMEAAVVGNALLGYKGQKDAKKGQQAALDAQMAGFRRDDPYIRALLEGSQGALNDSIAQGTYQGDTYAAMDPRTREALEYISQQSQAYRPIADNLVNTGSAFGQNYADLYEMAGQDRMGAAQDYALANADPLIRAAMRDPYRELQENTLPGINLGASGSGNAGSSRAGVAEAVAQRGYGDRLADMSSTIQDSLMTRYLTDDQQRYQNMMNANLGLRGAFDTGMGMTGTLADWQVGAGDRFQRDAQGQMVDSYNRFNEQRDFPLNQYIKYNQGILANANWGSPQNPTMVTASPIAGALGGAMQGYGMGNEMGFDSFLGKYMGGGGSSQSGGSRGGTGGGFSGF